MTEKQLIKKIKGLGQIKPREDWVVFAKKQILGEEPLGWQEQFSSILEIFPRVIFQKKLAYVPLTILIVLVGVFGFAQQTVPGDLLFPLKKATEQSQTVLVSGREQPRYDLEIVNKRLEDLTKVAKANRVGSIAPIIDEFQASVSRAAKSLVKEGSNTDSDAIMEIALEIKKLEENKQEIEFLGIVIGDSEELKELTNALAPLVQREIEDLENSILTEEQQELLEEAKTDSENGNYNEALIKVLLISN